jgi:hypothetical protein
VIVQESNVVFACIPLGTLYGFQGLAPFVKLIRKHLGGGIALDHITEALAHGKINGCIRDPRVENRPNDRTSPPVMLSGMLRMRPRWLDREFCLLLDQRVMSALD